MKQHRGSRPSQKDLKSTLLGGYIRRTLVNVGADIGSYSGSVFVIFRSCYYADHVVMENAV